MVLGSIFGNYLGAKLSLKKGDKFIKKIIFASIVLLFVFLGIKYIL
jgi:uncharacterized membrane protein YfcA